jgi:hypothetical protein
MRGFAIQGTFSGRIAQGPARCLHCCAAGQCDSSADSYVNRWCLLTQTSEDNDWPPLATNL